MIYAIVGAGGKTTYIKNMAKKYHQQGKKVLVCTSTHMYIEKDTCCSDNAEEIITRLEKDGYVTAGIAKNDKIGPLSMETYLEVCKHCDVVLIEADGSKHLPLKYPREKEPVIYDNVDTIVIVCGLHALNKKAKDVIHCYALAKENLQIQEDESITLKHIQKLVQKGYKQMLMQKYSDKKIDIKAQHSNPLFARVVSAMLNEGADLSLIKEEWFQTTPTLFICGGGHVAKELADMASLLDFNCIVMDDREEFANKERFTKAQKVICDTFDHLHKYLVEDAYYVVVSRGHKDDYTCVKQILNTKYSYLGMIGSKLKVSKQMENLAKEGFDKEVLDSIFAPIGLSINAVTPAEIAVSILAQIIQEKNKKHISSISTKLLECKKPGVLCIIIEKHGSSPRGVGSMMLVCEDEIIDSIGGGAVEYAAIEDAKECSSIMIKEYALNNKDSVRLGMICGGTNKVLFVPLGE